MSDAPPQLGEIPKQSEFQVPTLDTTSTAAADHTTTSSTAAATDSASSNAASSVESTKNPVVNTAQSAMETVANHPITQNVANHPITQNVKDTVLNAKDTVANGPVAQNVKAEANKTQDEASRLAATRKVPDAQAATGQPLTHYHSFFYSLLAWEHPRVTAISYLTIITAIFIARYVPLLRLTLKTLSYVLGTAALLEGSSQVILGQSVISTVRPKRYFTIPREALDSTLEDVEQLLNFFVIESQRLVFAEDASKTLWAFLAAFLGYWLVKIVPFWGLSLIAVTTIYFVPLIYISNREIIDEQLNQFSQIVNAQTAQVKELAAQHTSAAGETLRSYTGDFTKQAQEYIGQARASVAPVAEKVSGGRVTEKDFPAAPKTEPSVVTTADQETDSATKLATGVPAY